MITLYEYLNSNNNCFICGSELSVVFGGKPIDKKENYISYNFSLVSRFNSDSHDNFSCTVVVSFDGKFCVDFYKDYRKDKLNYIPNNVYDVYCNLIFKKDLTVFRYCPNCGDYSCKSSILPLDHKSSTCGLISLQEEWIYFKNCNGFDMSIVNRYDFEKSKLTIYDKKSDMKLPSTIKDTFDLDLIKKPFLYEDYFNKIKKYLMLI